MKLTIQQTELERGLSIVRRAVAGKTTLPVLHNVLLDTRVDESLLTLSATNLELSLSVQVQAKVTQGGSITLPAALLSDYVHSLPAEPLTLESDDRTGADLACHGRKTKIRGIDAQEFPALNIPHDLAWTTLPAEPLRYAIDAVGYAVAKDQARPILTGIYTRLGDDLLVVAASDGYRVAECSVDVKGPMSG